MTDRSSNGEYKYREENADKPRSLLDKDDKDSQVDKTGEYVRELLQEKLEIDSQKWPNALRLIDQGKNFFSTSRVIVSLFFSLFSRAIVVQFFLNPVLILQIFTFLGILYFRLGLT